MDPPSREQPRQDQRPLTTTPHKAPTADSKRKHSPYTQDGAKKQRNDIAQLPLTADGNLQYRTKHQLLFKQNDREPDTIFSKQNPDEVNFCGPRVDKIGDTFSGVIKPTHEVVAGLGKTILAEVGPLGEGKLVTFTFSVVSEAEYRKSKDAVAASIQPDNPPVPKPVDVLGCPWELTQQRHPSQPHTHRYQVRAPVPDMYGLLHQPSQPVVLVENIPPATVATPNPDNNNPRQSKSPSSGDSSLLRPERGLYRPPQSQRSPFPSRDIAPREQIEPVTLKLATIFSNEMSEEIRSKVLQSQWPVHNGTKVTAELSVLGCIAVVHRNILRALYEAMGLKDTISNVFGRIRELCDGDGKAFALVEYLARDMTRPKEVDQAALYDKEVVDLNKILAGLVRTHKMGRGIATNLNRVTFQYLVLNNLVFDYFWEVKGLALYDKVHHWEGGNSTMYKKEAADRFDLPRVVKFHSDGLHRPGTIRLEDTVNRLFAKQKGSGKCKARECKCDIKPVCAMPAVIRVHYTSGSYVPRTGSTYRDWLRDGCGRDLRGFKVRRGGESKGYRLMAVVKMRNVPGENNCVRIYDGIGRCVYPLLKPADFEKKNRWSLGEESTEFMLYYSPSTLDPGAFTTTEV